MSSHANEPAGHTIHAGAGCPPGKKVLGGGVDVTYEVNSFDEQSKAHVLYSYPSSDTVWSAGVINHNNHDLVYRWWAICAATT